MDSSPVFRNQSQNKINRDLQRMKNEQNKMMMTNPKPFKLQSEPRLSKQNGENQDPGNVELGRKAPMRPGVSRLPVLAKSHHLQTPSDYSQFHLKWEEKPLAGKTRKKKPCTRPVPFNLLQPKSSRTASENQQPSQSRRGHHVFQPENNICNANQKIQSINTKHSKLAMVGSTKGMVKSQENSTDNTTHASGQSGPCNTFKPSTTLSNPLSSISNNAMHHNSAPSSAPSKENSFTNVEPFTVKDPTKTSHASQNLQLTKQGNCSKSSTDKGETFQLDHAALLSILCNEGVKATGLVSGTPQSKPYNYLPQRVSVMKSQQKAGRAAAGSVKSVQFSPDAVALKSIIQNEGLKAAGPVCATPKSTICPSGRGTSIYTAQRVPVRRNRAEPTAGPADVAVKDTPLNKWTPQRVRDTRRQPMSAMKWHLSTQQSPYAATGSKSCKTNLQPNQEEVVQRLFDDQEDEQNTDKDPGTQAEQPPAQNPTSTSHSEENLETRAANTSEDEDEDEEEQYHTTVVKQPFFQAPERKSVIFFSAGKLLYRAPRFKKQESSSNLDHHSPVTPEQRTDGKAPEETPSVAEPTHQMVPSVQSLHRDLILQKSCSLSPAVALLRKRFPPLEELRMDEEVATYTSVSVPAAHGFLPPRPRCGNPLATILHFEESTTFVPIGFDLSSGPSSPVSSTLQGR